MRDESGVCRKEEEGSIFSGSDPAPSQKKRTSFHPNKNPTISLPTTTTQVKLFCRNASGKGTKEVYGTVLHFAVRQAVKEETFEGDGDVVFTRCVRSAYGTRIDCVCQSHVCVCVQLIPPPSSSHPNHQINPPPALMTPGTPRRCTGRRRTRSRCGRSSTTSRAWRRTCGRRMRRPRRVFGCFGLCLCLVCVMG